MFLKKNRVDEDLERIREANLPNKEEIKMNAKHSDDLGLEKGDLLAMVLAVISLILPYVIAFLGAIGVVIFFMYLFFS
jgi:hypothetical protein